MTFHTLKAFPACVALLAAPFLTAHLPAQDAPPDMEKPGEHHQHLKLMAGTWDMKSKMHHVPGQVTEGTGVEIAKMQPGGQGGPAECDTWDNATLNCDVEIDGQTVPMRLQQKRLAPGQTNSWHFEAIGTEGGVRYNTRDANTIQIYEKEKDGWTRIDLGHAMAFPVITGGIFEAGFPDLNLQMWAAYAAERAGELNNRFGCATPDEAAQSHELWDAALKSHEKKTVVEL